MKKYLLNDRGFTLVEVLVTLAITGFVTSILYSVFLTGLNLFEKIEVEGQLRDDADYIATVILDKMYANSPKDVRKYENTANNIHGIELTLAKDKKIDGYVLEDDEKEEVKIKIYFQKDLDHGIEQFVVESTDPTVEKLIVDQQASKFTTTKAGESSEITLSCQKVGSVCQHGTINLQLVLEGRKSFEHSLIKTRPLVLKSSFGF